jgi:virginiamycin B lyase
MTKYTIPTAGSQSFGSTVGPDGALWFSENSGNKIGSIIP